MGSSVTEASGSPSFSRAEWAGPRSTCIRQVTPVYLPATNSYFHKNLSWLQSHEYTLQHKRGKFFGLTGMYIPSPFLEVDQGSTP